MPPAVSAAVRLHIFTPRGERHDQRPLCTEGTRPYGVRTIGAGSLAAALLAGGALATGAAGATVPNLGLGTPHSGPQPIFVALYDGHKDTYVSTDVSSKSQAKALKINYAASLTGAKGASPMYLVQGPATAGQVAVFGLGAGRDGLLPALAGDHRPLEARPEAGSLCSSRTTRSRAWPRRAR